MSILLDALKKSEAQRQLGNTPTIHTAVAGQSAGPLNELQWLPLSMLAISAVVLAWTGWQQYEKPDLIQLAQPATASREVSAMPGDSTESNEMGDDRRQAASNSLSAEAAVDGSEPTPGFTVLPPGQAQPTAEQSERLADSFSNYQAEPKQAADSEIPVAEVAVDQSQQDMETAADDTPEEPVAPPVPDFITFWELPQSIRDSMPEIKITVLVYAEEAEDRFLLVNGQRLQETESLGGGVELDEIRREGAVFTYRKYRFLIEG